MDYKDVEKNISNIVEDMKFLDKYLEGKKYLVGDLLTIADITSVCILSDYFRFVLNNE